MRVIRKMKESRLLRDFWRDRWTVQSDQSVMIHVKQTGERVLIKQIMHGK